MEFSSCSARAHLYNDHAAMDKIEKNAVDGAIRCPPTPLNGHPPVDYERIAGPGYSVTISLDG